MDVHADHRSPGLSHRIAAAWCRLSRMHRKVGRHGLAMVQANLAFAYENGYGVPQSHIEAARRYRKAADLGIVFAQVNLGAMYEKGQGVPMDPVQAQMWWILAGVRGDLQALENRDRLAASMTPDQIAEAWALAAAWKPRTGQ